MSIERKSPSGRYKLTVEQVETKPGCWAYTIGKVVRISDGQEIARIERNYSSFPFAFVEREDEDYLVCGRSYMGQTVVALRASREWNDPSFGKYEGYEFCWSSIMPFADGKTLFVNGCHWAAPYEYRFYDFTDPAAGWAELKIEGSKLGIKYLSSSDFRSYAPMLEDEDDGDADEVPEPAFDGDTITFSNADLTVRLRRDGFVMRVVEERSSERRTKALADWERRQAEWNDKVRAWMDADVFLPWLKKQPSLIQRSDGYMTSSQHDRETGADLNPLHIRVSYAHPYDKTKKERPSATLSWGVDSGPISLEKWTYGIGTKTTKYERTFVHLATAYDEAMRHVLA